MLKEYGSYYPQVCDISNNDGSYYPQVCEQSWNAFFAEKNAPAAGSKGGKQNL